MSYLVFTVFWLFVALCNSQESLTEFTKAEEIALKRFRPLVSDVLVRPEEHLDSFLIRWLRARDLNLERAASMLREAQAFRKKYRLDTILEETIFDPSPLEYSIEGFDLEGNPVFTLAPTSIDLRAYMLKGLRDKVFRYLLQTIEKALIERQNASRIYGKDVNQVVAIVDLHGFNLRQHGCISCLPLFTELAITFENYYPRLLKHMIAINVPRIATPIIEIIRPLLSEYNANTLKILSTDRKEWPSVLNKIIAPDQLSYRFGGLKKN